MTTSRVGMRATLRIAIGGLIAVACTLAAAVPAQALSDPAGPEVAAAGGNRIVTAAGLPASQSLDARWDPDEAAPMPSTTRTLSATVPRALFDFGTPLTALIAGAQRHSVPVTAADPATRTVTVDIPEGYFSSPEGPPGMATGSPRYSLVLETRKDEENGSRSTAYVSIGFAAGAAGALEHSRVVAASDAVRYSSAVSFKVEPDAEVEVSEGDTIVIDELLPFSPTSSVTTDRSPWLGGASVPTRAMSTGGTAIEVEVPLESSLAPLLTSRVMLSLEGTVDRTRVFVTLPYTQVHSAASGPGTTVRLGASDRFAAAAAYSQAMEYRPGTRRPTLAVASGTNFPDALSAAAATAYVGGSVLLVRRGDDGRSGMGGAACGEAGRISPRFIYLVGGLASISNDTNLGVQECSSTSDVFRIEGADRYEVSRWVALNYFRLGAPTVFIATGATFPDALSAVTAAATQDAPVILVRGASATVDQATLDLFQTLGARRFVIVGGPASISPGIQSQLSTLGSVERISGADRYEVSAAVNSRFFPVASEAFLATGSTFPDALTGGVLAASRNAPLVLVRTNCLPVQAHAALTRWNVSRTTLLGGTASLDDSVMDLTRCG
jgi:hypothetical protein